MTSKYMDLFFFFRYGPLMITVHYHCTETLIGDVHDKIIVVYVA